VFVCWGQNCEHNKSIKLKYKLFEIMFNIYDNVYVRCGEGDMSSIVSVKSSKTHANPCSWFTEAQV